LKRAHERRRLDPEDRRLELLVAAEHVLRKKGLDARVEDVVHEARAAKGTFYVYFESWEDLLLAVRARVFEDFDRRFPLPAGNRETDWWKALEAAVAGFVDFVAELGGLHEALFHGPIADAYPIDPQASAAARIAAFLSAGVEAGVFASVDAERAAPLIFAMMHGAADAAIQGEDRDGQLATLLVLLRRMLEP
jgi:AcrR family transcriptional regulator